MATAGSAVQWLRPQPLGPGLLCVQVKAPSACFICVTLGSLCQVNSLDHTPGVLTHYTRVGYLIII